MTKAKLWAMCMAANLTRDSGYASGLKAYDYELERWANVADAIVELAEKRGFIEPETLQNVSGL